MASMIRPRWPIHQNIQCLSQQFRQFSLSTSRQAGSKQALAHAHANLPQYPYGPSRWYKQSNFGLYGGLKITSGNNVSPKTETKTRRKWRPNVQMKRLYSHALGRHVRVKVATRVLRTIDKCGGLDEYLVGSEKAARVKELGMKGWELRCKVMGTEWWAERKTRQREEWGLSPIRRYIPEEKEDEEGREVLVGMFGEKIQSAKDAAAARAEAEEDADMGEVALADDGDTVVTRANNKELPDLVAYNEAEEVDEAAASEEEFDDGEVVELPGRLEVPAEYQYISGKLKRRAIIKEKKAIAKRLKAQRYVEKRGGVEQLALAGEKGLKAHDLRQHLDYQKRKLELEEAGKLLAPTDASTVESRPRV